MIPKHKCLASYVHSFTPPSSIATHIDSICTKFIVIAAYLFSASSTSAKLISFLGSLVFQAFNDNRKDYFVVRD